MKSLSWPLQRIHDTVKPEPNILFFLNKSVLVECAPGYTVEGKLIRYKLGCWQNHLPTVLIVQNKLGKHVVRSWRIIKTFEKVLA